LKLPIKIANLEKLKLICNVPKFLYFNLQNYKKNKKKIIKIIQKKLKKNIIIRSATFIEDRAFSNAGKFLSIPNINSINSSEIESAIKKVFESYGKNKKNEFVLVQEYIQNAESVGVIFTTDPKNGSPFRTINFNNSNSTDLITSGKSNGQIIYYFKNISALKINRVKKIKKIESIIRRLEKKFVGMPLDIEFLICKRKVYILQLRKLKTYYTENINFKKSLGDLEKKIFKMKDETSHLLGKNRYFSTMTDWNPAEIIGLKPKPLALSLYQSLITDEIWSESRSSLGYKDVTKMPLLYSFLGTPYVDLKTDINSFLVPSLDEKIQTKLLSLYFKKFKEKPNYYYDKIESSLVVNSISLDIKKYKNLLIDSKLSKKEVNKVIAEYTKLTSEIIFKLKTNIKRYEYGEMLFERLKSSKNSTINKIYLMHNICKSYGTLPFANLARMAFIAVEFLNSFENLNIISKEEKKHFLETIKSVSFEMNKKLNKSKKQFLKEYGHLRPNTYEISNPNYRQNFNNYFNKVKINLKRPKKFNFNFAQKTRINNLLKKTKFKEINANSLINFIQLSIYQRENSKLFFTKIINEIFSQLKILFKRIGLNERNIEYLDIKKILSLYENFSHKDIIYDLNKNITENKKIYKFNKNFNLPNIITNEKDIYFFEEQNASPTFITNKIVISKFIQLKKFSQKFDFENKIICIENADPGYDFIFNHKINGLITAFGGPNSHMSIRCNEFGLPAAIGIGEKKFHQLIKNNTLYLNCEKQMLSGL
jgi:hypothetical protein